MALSCVTVSFREARIADRVTDREMVDDLPVFGCQVEIAVDFLVEKCANAGGAQPERFRGEIQAMADSAGFEMHIAITAVAMSANGAFDIADHRERHAGVSGEILPEAQARGRDTLVAMLDPLQLGTLWPEPVYAGFQAMDAMDVQVELDETNASEIGVKRVSCGSQDGRELRQRYRLRSTGEVER